MASTPMDIDRPDRGAASNGASLNIQRTLGGTASVSNLSDVISTFRPTKLFRRDDIKDGRPLPHILSIDYDDEGELVMASASDETIQIYNVKEGRHDKSLLSKKYGVKLAKFTHTNSSIIYASTKQNGMHTGQFLPITQQKRHTDPSFLLQMQFATSPPMTTPSSATSKAMRVM